MSVHIRRKIICFFYRETLNLNTDPYFGNVSLLLRGTGQIGSSANILDESSNAFSITRVGDATLSSVVKKYGNHSMKFDGSGDYLSLTTNSAFDFGIGNYTIEFWIYVNDLTLGPTILSKYTSWASNVDFVIEIIASNNKIRLVAGDNAAINISSDSVIATNTWTHVAFVRDNNTTSMFIDGVKQTQTHTGTVNIPNDANALGIGADNTYNGNFFNGYIDDLRITKGVARYTGNFTPPTDELPASSPADPYYANVSLLLRGKGAILDESPSTLPVTIFGQTVLSSAVKKYGAASLQFDGSGDYLSLPTGAAFQFGTGDFTVEAWIYVLSYSAVAAAIYDNGIGVQLNSFVLYLAQGHLKVYTQGGYKASSNNTVPTNAWTHIAIVRQSGVLKYFINGVLDSSTPSFDTNCTTGRCLIGADANEPNNLSYNFHGYMDDFRITKGVARYTGNFTPPDELPNS